MSLSTVALVHAHAHAPFLHLRRHYSRGHNPHRLVVSLLTHPDPSSGEINKSAPMYKVADSNVNIPSQCISHHPARPHHPVVPPFLARLLVPALDLHLRFSSAAGKRLFGRGCRCFSRHGVSGVFVWFGGMGWRCFLLDLVVFVLVLVLHCRRRPPTKNLPMKNLTKRGPSMSRHPRPRPHRGHVQLTVSCLFLSGGVKEGRIRRGTVGDRHGSAGVSCRRRAFSFFLLYFLFLLLETWMWCFSAR